MRNLLELYLLVQRLETFKPNKFREEEIEGKNSSAI